MHLLYVITHTIIKNSNLKIKHQNMFKYPKSANSLGKIKKMLLQQQQQQQHKHGGGRGISSSAFYVFYGKLIIRILIKKCSMAGSNKQN